MNIIIPLAGKDKNFEAMGMIKPLTKVCNKEIIKWISESRPFSYENAIFIVLKEHQEQYGIIDELKRLFGGDIRLVVAEQMTEGAPQSILLAKHLINNDEELLIDLGDQYLDLSGFNKFVEKNKDACNGIIPTFESYYYNRGYIIIRKDGLVKKVSEKDEIPISTHSTACISYFRKGSDFVKYAEQMIAKKRVAANGAYLPSLVYNEMIEDNKKILACPCELVAPLGTIEGADCFPQINKPLKWKNDKIKRKLILHRGYKGKYPENSKIAFENSLKEGFDFETDIRVSKDGECFMIHDYSLDRLFNGSSKVEDFYSNELVKLRYKEDSSQGLCSLKELCDLMENIENKQGLIFIHIKELKDVDRVIEILKNYDFQDRTRFFACDEITMDLIDITKEKYPKYKVGLHFYENNNFNEEDFKKADFIWADEITKENISEEFVDLAHKLSKPVYAISPEIIPESIFNSDIKKRWGEMLDIGVDGICTDKPDGFLRFAFRFKKN